MSALAAAPQDFTPPRHADDLGIFACFVPKSQKNEIGLAKSEVFWAMVAVIEDVFVQQPVQLHNGEIQVVCGFGFGIELFYWVQRSRHLVLGFPSARCGGARTLYSYLRCAKIR